MGKKPTPQHTLDRVDNDLGYSKVNCRWATQKEQHNNTRRNVVVEYNGVSKTVSEWAEDLGLPYHVVYVRIKKGWPAEKAFTQEVKARKDSSVGNYLVK